MENEALHFTLDEKMLLSLQEYSEILQRPIDTIIKEALEEYFFKVEKELLEKNMADENAITNLSYNEFWDGVDL